MRSHRAWLLVLVLFVDAPAHARQPPPTREEEIRKENEGAVEAALARCSAETARRGEFAIVEVKFRYSLYEEFSPVVAANKAGLDRKRYWCIAKALGALRLESLPGRDQIDRVKDYALGDPKALFPTGLLPAWRRAGWGQRPVEAALGPMLPPDVDVTTDGCLRLNGSEVLSLALWQWLERTVGKPISVHGGENEYDHPLPDDWWIRHTRPDEISYVLGEKICLSKLDAAGSALRRHRDDLRTAGGFRTFHAEWVVDAQGGIPGEIGFCLMREQWAPPDTAADAAERRAALETALRRIAFGRAPGPRRIVLDWERNGHLASVVFPAKETLTLDRSKTEAHCDPRRTLACKRSREKPELGPAARDALFRCINEASLDTHTVSISFDVSPDGMPENVVARGSSSARPVRAPTLACLEAVFKDARYASSDGGPCGISIGLDGLIEP